MSRAIDTLPKGLKPFYKTHRLEMPSLALEPSFPEDSPERRFAVDRLMPWPFADLPHTEKEMKARYGDQATAIGRLPWLIQDSYAQLVAAFKSGDKVKILTESDVLALFVAEVHNPLSLTDNADGQKTGQHGLWIRSSVKLVEAMKDRLKVEPDAARYPRRARRVRVLHDRGELRVARQPPLCRHARAQGQGGLRRDLLRVLRDAGGRNIADRLSRAAEDAGSYWYTAWTAAGRPELK